jgi:hypothetical protein
MTAAACVTSFTGSRDATRRLAHALALSVAAHLFLVESLALETALRTTVQAAAPVILTARLEPAAEAEPEGPSVPAPLPKVERVRARGIEHVTASARVKQGTETTLALPQPPDPTYYSARDLDVYPRPVAPLELDTLVRGRGLAATIFRFQALIDESGTANEVTPVEGEPLSLRNELLAVLAATRFHPGRKDGRAVKSRVTLSIDFDSERRNSPAR